MTMRGYKQTPEHIRKRIRRGEAHHSWLADAVSTRGGRTRALRLYPRVGPCVQCGAAKAERHHADGDTGNNSPDNVVVLCRRCHMAADRRLPQCREAMRQIQPLGVAARAARHVDTLYSPGDACPRCGKPLGVTATRHHGDHSFTYIGCRKSRRGCGWNAGSTKHQCREVGVGSGRADGTYVA